MREGKAKSRTFRRVKVKVPGNTAKLHYRKKKPSSAKCGNCGDVLNGVPRERPYKIKKMPKTAKRPERPYGGVLCSKCMRLKIKENIK